MPTANSSEPRPPAGRLTGVFWVALLALFTPHGFLRAQDLPQQASLTASVSITASGTFNGGGEQDSYSVTATGTMAAKEDPMTGFWETTSSNLSVTISGGGTYSDGSDNTATWTYSDATPDLSFDIMLDDGDEADALSGNLDPWVDMAAQAPNVVINSSPSGFGGDALGLVGGLWGQSGVQLNVPSNQPSFSVSGSTNLMTGTKPDRFATLTASYQLSYHAGPSNALAITSVQTPATVNGNQYTFISSDTIMLTAYIGVVTADVPVLWAVQSLNGAGPAVVIDSQPVNSDASGNSIFSFSPAQISAFVNFRKAHFTQGSSGAPNDPLNFEVVATALNQTVTLSKSGVGTLKQDDIDTLRQEYVDYKTIYQGGPYIPQRTDVVPSLGNGYNKGNYDVQLDKNLVSTFQAILQAYQGSTITFGGVTATLPATAQITVNSGYRNPQRNKAAGSIYPQTSIHMFGGALDLKPQATQVFVNGQLQNADINQTLYPALQQAAATQGRAFPEVNAIPVPLGCNGCYLYTDTNGVKQYGTENHIHVQW